MTATLTLVPDGSNIRTPIVVQGDGFLENTKCVISIRNAALGLDFSVDIVSDQDGAFSSTDEANPATGTLTSSGVDVTANDTVTIGAVTYTFKAGPTTVANEVKIGGTAAITLANLKKAINLTGVAGTDYGSLTVIHPTVRADTITATTLLLVAKTAGTGGNSLAFSKSAATLSVTAATLTGGAAATGVNPVTFRPMSPGTYVFSATDGTSTATASSRVSTGG